MKLQMLSAYLWDLRAQCEQQVRALTDAQLQLEKCRDDTEAAARDAALAALQKDLARVIEANAAVRLAAHEAVEQAHSLAIERWGESRDG
jgi:hypothetical protein